MSPKISRFAVGRPLGSADATGQNVVVTAARLGGSKRGAAIRYIVRPDEVAASHQERKEDQP